MMHILSTGFHTQIFNVYGTIGDSGGIASESWQAYSLHILHLQAAPVFVLLASVQES